MTNENDPTTAFGLQQSAFTSSFKFTRTLCIFVFSVAVHVLSGATLILEDFSSGASNFTTISGGTWSVSSGRYIISSPASSSTPGILGNISVHNTSISGDFELSATMHLVGTSAIWNDAAIIFGYQDSDNYYYVSLNESNDNKTKGLLKIVSGVPTELADIGISVSSDTDYQIGITRNGSSIAVSVNSSQVVSISDSTFTSGKVGVATYNDSAQFDNLVVTAGIEAPTRVASWGPNGTHWPTVIDTPFLYDTSVENIIEVACSWSAIESAISSVSSTEAAEGVLILVQPGTLTGTGASGGYGSGSNPVLESLGSSSWSKRITVAPRDGYGSVTMTNGTKFTDIRSVCFAGFIFEGGLKVVGGDRSAFAWILVDGFFAANGYSGAEVTDLELVELVATRPLLGEGDTADCYSSGADLMSGYTFVGCYFTPRYREINSSAHSDSLQFEPLGGVDYTDVYMLDCAFFASSLCAIQTNAIDGLTLENCYIAGGSVSQARYPFPSGADTSVSANCFNGTGQNITAIDCYFLGGLGSAGSSPWTYVSNTYLSTSTTATPASGSWTVNTSLNGSNPTMPPEPTSTYLNSIWSP